MFRNRCSVDHSEHSPPKHFPLQLFSVYSLMPFALPTFSKGDGLLWKIPKNDLEMAKSAQCCVLFFKIYVGLQDTGTPNKSCIYRSRDLCNTDIVIHYCLVQVLCLSLFVIFVLYCQAKQINLTEKEFSFRDDKVS